MLKSLIYLSKINVIIHILTLYNYVAKSQPSYRSNKWYFDYSKYSPTSALQFIRHALKPKRKSSKKSQLYVWLRGIDDVLRIDTLLYQINANNFIIISMHRRPCVAASSESYHALAAKCPAMKVFLYQVFSGLAGSGLRGGIV